MRIFLFLWCLFLPAISYAHESTSQPKKEGQTVLHLSVAESVTLRQDLLQANATLKVEGLTPRIVQNDLNSKMAGLLRGLRKFGAVKVQTGQYYVRPIYAKELGHSQGKHKIIGYSGSQTIVLKGKESTQVLEATALLQEEGILVQNLQFSLSPEKRHQVKEGLIEKAVKKLKAQAERVAQTLGKKAVTIEELHVDTQNAPNQPVRAYALNELNSIQRIQKPVAQAGEASVSLTVRARILVGP